MNPTLTIDELRRMREEGRPVQMIDVRSGGEYAAGHIPGAINVPLDETEARLDDIATGIPTVLVCQSGRRAGMACELLRTRRPDLIVLEGGTAGWIQKGLPTISSRKVRWSLERQVRFGAGLLVLTGAILGFTVNPGWFGLSAFVGAGLTFAGLTDLCPMAILLALMPWNKAKTCPTQEAVRA